MDSNSKKCIGKTPRKDDRLEVWIVCVGRHHTKEGIV